jgi:hemolysin activation/secretion protein
MTGPRPLPLLLRAAAFAASLAASVAWAAPAEPALDDIVYFTVERFEVTGDNPLSSAETDALLAPYLGDQAGFLGLQNAADALQQAIRAAGFSFHRVVVPPQRARDSIELRALVFRVGAVQIEDNAHFSADNVRAMLPSLTPGQTPDSRAMKRDIQHANEHPAKRLALVMRQGETPGEIDAVVSVRDQSPHSFVLTANNRGSKETGEERLSAGYQYSNLFGLDHVVTASYTTSPGHWDDVRQYGLTYKIPLYERAADLTFVASYSDVDNGTVADFFAVTGRGTVLGAVYDHSLLGIGRYGHRVQLSLFDKAFKNDVDFLGQPVGTDVRSRPVTVQYTGEWVREAANLGLSLGLSANLPSGADNTQAAYTASRAGASTHWHTWKGGGFADVGLGGNWLLRTRLAAQYAGEPLIPGEQFGLGGAGSIRGFLPRVASSDDGVAATAELWLPKPRADLQVIAFLDGGVGWRHNSQAGEDSRPELVSAGAGLRWQPLDAVRASVDWGLVLNGTADTEAGNQRVHFTLSMVL